MPIQNDEELEATWRSLRECFVDLAVVMAKSCCHMETLEPTTEHPSSELPRLFGISEFPAGVAKRRFSTAQ